MNKDNGKNREDTNTFKNRKKKTEQIQITIKERLGKIRMKEGEEIKHYKGIDHKNQKRRNLKKLLKIEKKAIKP